MRKAPNSGMIAYLRFPELRRRFFVTLGLLLGFRLLAQIPVFNVEQERLNELLAKNSLLGLVDLFAGGDVLNQFSIVATGILPYLTALLLIHILAWLVPPLRDLKKLNPKGRERIEFYAKLATVPLAFAFAWGLSRYLAQQTGLFPDGVNLFTAATFMPTLYVLLLMTAGSMVSAGLVGWISEWGIGSGASVILLTGSSLGFINQIRAVIHESGSTALLTRHLTVIAIAGIVVIVFGILLMRTTRRVPIEIPHSPQPQKSRLYQRISERIYLPLPLVVGGIVPVSAAVGLLTLIQFTANLLETYVGAPIAGFVRALNICSSPENGGYWLSLAGLTLIFTYLYNFSLLWQPFGKESPSIAESLRRQSHSPFIKGVRPGRDTQVYLEQIMRRITLPSAVALAALAVGLPWLVQRLFDHNVLVIVLSLIVFVKTLDEVKDRMDVEVSNRSYDGLLRSGGRHRI